MTADPITAFLLGLLYFGLRETLLMALAVLPWAILLTLGLARLIEWLTDTQETRP